MLVYEGTANGLYRELSRIENSRHFVYERALITRKILRSKLKMHNAKLRNHRNNF